LIKNDHKNYLQILSNADFTIQNYNVEDNKQPMVTEPPRKVKLSDFAYEDLFLGELKRANDVIDDKKQEDKPSRKIGKLTGKRKLRSGFQEIRTAVMGLFSVSEETQTDS